MVNYYKPEERRVVKEWRIPGMHCRQKN